jgi:hypothetical protein
VKTSVLSPLVHFRWTLTGRPWQTMNKEKLKTRRKGRRLAAAGSKGRSKLDTSINSTVLCLPSQVLNQSSNYPVINRTSLCYDTLSVPPKFSCFRFLFLLWSCRKRFEWTSNAFFRKSSLRPLSTVQSGAFAFGLVHISTSLSSEVLAKADATLLQSGHRLLVRSQRDRQG